MRLPPSELIASREAVSLITDFESFRSIAYRDAAGVWTIGFGSTRGVKEGHRISVMEALRRLSDDIMEAETAIRQYVSVPLSRGEFDALTSFVFNVGSGAFARSSLRRKLNENEREGAADEFGRWIYSGGKALAGLRRRREAEKELFLL